MLVSILISAYNGEEYLDKCIGSILGQTYKRIEVILFNDASKDNTLEKMRSYQQKYPEIISVYSSETNQGPGGGKSEALKHAQGEYVAFMDCDDYFSETYIEKLVEEAKKDLSVDIIISGFTKVDTEGNQLYIRKYANEMEALYQSVPAWGKLYRKAFLDKNQLYLPYFCKMDDVLFNATTIIAGPKVRVCVDAGYYYVLNKKSISHTTLRNFHHQSLQDGFNYITNYLEKRKVDYNKELMAYLTLRYVTWHLLKSGCQVGHKNMEKEYNEAFKYMNQYFPNYRKAKFFLEFKPKGERRIVKLATYGVWFLKKIGLAKLFFNIYSDINLERMWPNL